MKKILFSVLSLATAGIAMAQNADTFALNRIGQEVTLSDINSAYVGCDCYVMDTTFTIGLDALGKKPSVRHGGTLKGWNASSPNAGKLSTSSGWTVAGTKISLTKPCYYLPGLVHIDSGVTMNIPAGTVFYGSKSTFSAFVQLPKSKVEAKGTAGSPIVFTSAKSTRERGDWGGVVITGRAPIAGDVTGAGTAGRVGTMSYVEGLSAYPPYLVGGKTENDYSGTWNYVQVNYAGLNVGASGSGNELNSFSLYGVGNATKMAYLQVAYANDDAIEIFGGAVNIANAFILNTLDDDLDIDGGYQGTIQNVLVYRLDTLSRDVSRSRLAEISNKNSNHPRKTMPVITNVTGFGLRAIVGKTYTFGAVDGKNTSDARSMTGFSIDKNSSARIYNSVVHGYDQAFHIDNQINANNLDSAWGPQFAYNSWNMCTNDITVGSSVTQFDASNDFPFDNKDNWIRFYQASNYKGASDDIKNMGYNVSVGQAVYPSITNLVTYTTYKKDYGNLAYALQKFGSGFGSNDTLDSKLSASIKNLANRGIQVSKLTNWTSTNPTDDYCGAVSPFGGSSSNDNKADNSMFANNSIELSAINPSEGQINVSIEGVANNQMSNVNVYDLSGTLVKSMVVSGKSVKVEGINVGLYTVVVSNNVSQESIKVFVK